MEGMRWLLLAVFCFTLVEGKNLEEGLGEGLDVLNQLFGGQDSCGSGYKCLNGE